jgi:hypothetical protein
MDAQQDALSCALLGDSNPTTPSFHRFEKTGQAFYQRVRAKPAQAPGVASNFLPHTGVDDGLSACAQPLSAVQQVREQQHHPPQTPFLHEIQRTD